MSTPVASGPGALSRRTDTGPAQKLRDLPDANYGENATYKDLQRAQGLSQSPGGDIVQGGATNPAMGNVVPINAPTQEPSTPVTAGANVGMGPGQEALGLVSHNQQDMNDQIKNLPVLEYMANQEGAPWALRNAVRKIKASM